MSPRRDEAGCREPALATLFLLGFAVVFMIAGWSLSSQGECRGACETVALTLLYAGGPLSAALGVLFGGVWLAWPLDVTLWVVVGFGSARFASRRSRGVLGLALVILLVALLYGLVLSQFVEIAT